MTEPAALAAALDQWRIALGAENVDTGDTVRQQWGRRTFAPDAAVWAILSPGSDQQVAACLAIATQYGVPVHPVSRGANWGLGSRAPVTDGGVVLNLQRLDRISDFDPVRGLVRVEPGVTFQALADFLTPRTQAFFLPTIGGPTDASVLANALERGDGSMGERWSSLCDFTIALPSGDILLTGCGPLGGNSVVGLTPSPAGPLIDGLFSQSNFGVVTSAVIRLEPMPGDLAEISFAVGGLADLPGFLAVWRDCACEQSLAERALTLWNGVKWLALDHVRSDVPPEQLAKAGIDEWYASTMVRAEAPDILELRVRRLTERFSPVVREIEVAPVRRSGVWAEDYEGYLGVPDGRNVRTLYWYRDSQPDLADVDLEREDFGLIWLCLAFPFEFAPLADYLVWAQDRLNAAGIDLNVGIESNGFRCLLSYFTIGYDRSRPGADADAMAAYRALLAEGVARGFLPYRLANGAPLPDKAERLPLNQYLARLRAVGDPAGVLSPGRGGVGGLRP